MHLILAVLAAMTFHHAPRPLWTVADESGVPIPQCPVGWSVYASERELLAGKDFVHCVKQ